MFYPHDERHNKLTRISEIDDIAKRIEALEFFINEEKNILSRLQVPTDMSQALTTAVRRLDVLLNPPESRITKQARINGNLF